MNAMLLNEFLNALRKLEEQGGRTRAGKDYQPAQVCAGKTRKDFACAIAQQQKEIKALNASLHKVSSELELMKPAPRVVANDQ